MKTKAYMAFLALPFLAACAVTGDTDGDATDVEAAEVDVVAEDTCNAAEYQEYIGQKSPAIELPPGTEMRHYRTGDPVTQDLRPERINFEYDRSGALAAVTCG